MIVLWLVVGKGGDNNKGVIHGRGARTTMVTTPQQRWRYQRRLMSWGRRYHLG